jgi:hypothetical protein
MMRKHALCLSIGFSLAGVAAAQTAPVQPAPTTLPAPTLPSGALNEEAIKSSIANAGYKEVKGLTFNHGVWETEARGGNDNWVDLRVAPVTGKVYPEDAPSRLNSEEIEAKLSAAGYQNIEDVEFHDGLWSADADNPAGDDVDLLVDPDDGSVVAEELD